MFTPEQDEKIPENIPIEIKEEKERDTFAWHKVVSFFAILTVALFYILSYKSWAEDVQFVSKDMLDGSRVNLAFAKGKESGTSIIKQEEKIIAPKFVGTETVPQSNFTAFGMAVRDVASGKILYEKNSKEEHPIASITKLMSALSILERNPEWTATTTVTREDDLSDNYMYAGDTFTLDELWKAALVGSSNKAIYTLADAVGISSESFAARMNQKAIELGMSQTHFVEPTGLNAENVSTAEDLTKLLSEAMKHKEIRDTVLIPEMNLYSEVRGKTQHMWNTDWLLLGWIPNAFTEFYGGKTGYITASGYNFSMRVGDGNGHLIDVVVLGTDTHEARFTEARDIAEWIFQNYTWEENRNGNIGG